MKAQGAHRLIWWTLVIITVVALTSALFRRRSFASPEFVIISIAIYALVGAVVSWRRSENPIGSEPLMVVDRTVAPTEIALWVREGNR
jgi:membrane associated rhomboid family serine protease